MKKTHILQPKSAGRKNIHSFKKKHECFNSCFLFKM